MIPRALACLSLLIPGYIHCTAEDFRSQLLKAIARGEMRFVIPPGAYRLTSPEFSGELLNLQGR